MESKAVIVIPNFKTPKQAGDYFRLVCLTGEKKGICYYLNGDRIVLGRGNEANIPVNDSKASRIHAELKRIGNEFIITDLNSQNGIIVNELKVKQVTLKEADLIVIGKTVYRYGKVKVEDEISKFEKEKSPKTKVQFGDPTKEEKRPEKKKNNRMILIVVVIGLLAWVLLDEDKGEQKKLANNRNDEKKTKDITDEFTNILTKKKEKEDQELQKKLDILFQRGLREIQAKNYFRAMSEFNMALIMSPQNARASFYLRKTRQLLDKEVEQIFLTAKRSKESLKYKSAIGDYCSILRLLQSFPEDERYKKAQDALKVIEQTMGKNEGEINCF